MKKFCICLVELKGAIGQIKSDCIRVLNKFTFLEKLPRLIRRDDFKEEFDDLEESIRLFKSVLEKIKKVN